MQFFSKAYFIGFSLAKHSQDGNYSSSQFNTPTVDLKPPAGCNAEQCLGWAHSSTPLTLHSLLHAVSSMQHLCCGSCFSLTDRITSEVTSRL